MVRVKAALKAHHVGSAVPGVDVIHKGEEVFLIGIRPLHGELEDDPFFLPFKIHRLFVDLSLYSLLRYSTKDFTPPSKTNSWYLSCSPR
jgi:hypothetical protein